MHPQGKVNYYIDGQMFENSPNKRDAKAKAEEYCLNNFLDFKDIIKFDSRTETNRYIYLLDLQNKGLISNLTHHFTFKIRDVEINANGETYPIKTYCADFVYKDQNNKVVIEDVKGSEYFVTSEFIDTKRDFDMTFKDKGYYIQIILYKNKEWCYYHIGDAKKSGKLIKKQSLQIKELKNELNKKNVAENKKIKEIKRIKELMNKDKLTKAEKERLNILKEKYKDGII